MRTSPRRKTAASREVTIGRNGGAKISAVEGVMLTRAAQRLFLAFDKAGLTPPQRRAELKARYAKPFAKV